MKRYPIYVIAVLLGFIVESTPAYSQKGTGENKGIAQQGLDLPVTTMRSKLLEIKAGPCEKSTGKSPYGTHLIVESQGERFNIHLGPAVAVDHVVNQLTLGSELDLEVFRTDRLPANAYIAKSLTLGEKTFHLRDENLRPSWAYGGSDMRQGQTSPPRKRGQWGPCW